MTVKRKVSPPSVLYYGRV